jgi:hypothetical protein
MKTKLSGWTYDKAHMHAKETCLFHLSLSLSLSLSPFFLLNGYVKHLKGLGVGPMVVVGNIWIILHASLDVCEEATCNPKNQPTSFEGKCLLPMDLKVHRSRGFMISKV